MKHEFSHTTVHHYKDGSHKNHHHHHSDPAKDVEYAVENHDAMMDGMQKNIGAEGGEQAAEAMPPAAEAAQA